MSFTSSPGPSDSNDQPRRAFGDTRPEMLRLLVREFLRQPVRNEAAEARFITLASRLIEAVDATIAARAVRELAPHPDVPRALVLQLATAPLAIAGPILRLSPVLDEADLAELAERAAPSHLAAMAARRDVSPTLAKRIAELVHRRGVEGTQAEIAVGSEPVEELGTDEAAGQNGTSTGLGENDPVALMAGLDPATQGQESAPAQGLEPRVKPGDEVKWNDGSGSSEEQAVSVLAELVSQVSEAAEEPAAATAPVAGPPVGATSEAPPDPTPPLPPIDYFAAGPEERAALVARLVTLPPLPLAERVPAPPSGFIDMLLDAAKAGSAEDVAGLIERTLGITEANARRIVTDETGEALAIAARALGLSFAILSRVLFRLHPVTGRSAAQMSRLAETFDGLPTASAQHLVASWRAGRRVVRDRPENAPSMRSFAQPHAVQAPQADATDSRRRNH